MSERPAFDIEILLRAQRGPLRPLPAEAAESYHHASYAALVQILTGYGMTDAPELVLVDSTHALTEMVHVGSKRWVVYDLHLGRIFARLNAVVDTEASLRSIDADLSRIYIGRLLVHGRSRDAYVVAVFHLVRLMDDLVSVDLLDPERQRMNHAEEIFVLAHELMHFVFTEHPAIASVLTNMYFELCAAEESDLDERPKPSAEEAAETFADDVNREWVRRHGDFDEAELAQGKEMMMASYLKRLTGHSLHTSRTAREDPVLSEEVVCDAGAAVLTAIVMGDKTADGTLDALAAAFDANQKLRLIKHMDWQIAGREKASKGAFDANSRGSQLRQFYRGLYESGLSGVAFGFTSTEADHVAMLNRIRIINERFYGTLFDQLLTKAFYGQFTYILDPDSPIAAAPSSVADCWKVASNAMFAED